MTLELGGIYMDGALGWERGGGGVLGVRSGEGGGSGAGAGRERGGSGGGGRWC